MSFNLFSIVFVLFFVAFLGTFVVVIAKSFSQWRKNNDSPKLSVEATLVSKSNIVRNHMHHHPGEAHHQTNMPSQTTSLTFQVASGDRMVFSVSHYDYNLMAEGDRGILHFQGTRFLGFDRYR